MSADLVTSVSSQLSGTLFAVTMFDTRTLLGKFVLPSVVLRATRKSPKARSEAHEGRGPVSEVGKVRVPAGPRNTGTLSGLLM